MFFHWFHNKRKHFNMKRCPFYWCGYNFFLFSVLFIFWYHLSRVLHSEAQFGRDLSHIFFMTIKSTGHLSLIKMFNSKTIILIKLYTYLHWKWRSIEKNSIVVHSCFPYQKKLRLLLCSKNQLKKNFKMTLRCFFKKTSGSYRRFNVWIEHSEIFKKTLKYINVK